MKKFMLIVLGVGLTAWSCTSKSDSAASEDQGHSHSEGTEHTHSDENSDASLEQEDFVEAFTVTRTENSPEFIQHASGVQIIKDVANWESKVGVETLEGYFGPLLFGSELRTFFIVLHPGQFLSEHPHPTESIVYTVSGKWVLCSEGNRQVMTPGTIFHFGNDKPTGWEVPFNQDAHLLVIKKRTADENYESYLTGLQDMASMMEGWQQEGAKFWFHEIGPENPARQFASTVNPDFDQLIADLEAGTISSKP